MNMRMVSVVILIFIMVSVIYMQGCGDKESNRGVIIVLIDALRKDHLNMYDYKRNTSPFMEELSKKSVFFRNIYSAAPQTVPSVSSIFTGLYPYRHGSHFFSVNQSYHPTRPVSDGGLPKMKQENRLMAEYFLDAGFFTAAIISNPGIRDIFGFSQGLNYYRFLNCFSESAAGVCNGMDINRIFIDEVVPQIEGRDFFIYLHYMDVHNPYHKPHAFKAKFTDYRGEPVYMNGKPEKISPEEIEYSEAHYDEGVIYMDGLLKDLLDKIKKSGLHDNTLVVITSDHGDEFFEHGGLGHGTTCYNELIESFIILYHPSLRPVVIESRGSLVDLLPTLLDWMDINYEKKTLEGESLLPLIKGPAEKPRKRVFLSELGDRKAILDGRWKYIYNLDTRREELYNLDIDPGEMNNISKMEEKLIKRYRESMKKIIHKMAVSFNIQQMTPEERKNLESLGYIN